MMAGVFARRASGSVRQIRSSNAIVVEDSRNVL